jgi:hypothetical protein
VSEIEIQSGRPTLSLVLAPADLDDPKRGILANVTAHGKEWEREGSVSYFDEGQLRFASGVGVRVHGGGSRLTSPRQGFRLYFRRKYGATQVPPGILFEADAQPIRRLVIHNDVRRDRDGTDWQFANPLAYDIAEAAGGIAPDTKTVRFFVNGEYYGVFVLTERIDDHFFEAHWGHGRIRLDQDEFDKLWTWVSGTRPLTMARVSEQVDLDNLTRWFLAVAFSATRDTYQGPGQFENRTRDRASWFWVNWDMDQSFRNWDLDSYQYLLERIGEDRKGRNHAEPRPRLLTDLIAEDPQYREFFKRTFQHLMNHRLTPAFLEARYRHYEALAGTMDVPDRRFLPRLKDFLERRPAFFRASTESWLNAEREQPLTVVSPEGVTLLVDGEPVQGPYRGMYFPDLDAVVAVRLDDQARFKGWFVDGVFSGRAPELRVRVTQPMQIEAAFERRAPSGSHVAPVTPASVPPAPASPAAPLTWVRVSGGPKPFEMLATEVTAAQFAAYAAGAGTRIPRQPSWFAKPDHPVMNVTWDEAQAFCSAAGGRLPTDAEWTQGAFAGAAPGAFPYATLFAGAANLQAQRGGDRFGFTAPVGSFAPNRYGLFDMWGNVWEWTSDAPGQTSWPGYDMRIVRGGSWDTSHRASRIAARVPLSRAGRHNLYVGFRCAR